MFSCYYYYHSCYYYINESSKHRTKSVHPLNTPKEKTHLLPSFLIIPLVSGPGGTVRAVVRWPFCPGGGRGSCSSVSDCVCVICLGNCLGTCYLECLHRAFKQCLVITVYWKLLLSRNYHGITGWKERQMSLSPALSPHPLAQTQA